MSGYVQKMLVRFKHNLPKRSQFAPYQAQPRKFGKDSDKPIPEDDSPKLDDERKKVVQQVIGTGLFYARAVDCTYYQPSVVLQVNKQMPQKILK